jgi:hypothetical protein
MVLRSHGWMALVAVLLGPWFASAASSALPAHLPRYRLAADIDVANHVVHGRLEATWINPHRTPTNRLVLNAHARHVVQPADVALVAKTLELLRMQPSDAMGVTEPPLEIHSITLVQPSGPALPLKFSYGGTTNTDLVVPLPFVVRQNESATILLDFTLTLPQKQGRWGQWDGITFLSHWLPMFAVYDRPMRAPDTPETLGMSAGPRLVRAVSPDEPAVWQPVPFIPWHQPFFNEAGIYSARITLPADHELACTGKVTEVVPLPNGRKQLDIEAIGMREFALLASAKYELHEGVAPAGPGGAPVRVRVLALPRHRHYAKKMVEYATTALCIWSRWLGDYPYPDFTIAEGYFGWNGNECSSLVMIDERVFGMPHVGAGYVEYLVTHETCHQWFYCQVGTNGYAETWMDEGIVSHLTNRYFDEKHGKGHTLLDYPVGLRWLPTIRREDYRSAGLYGALGRGEDGAVVRPMEKFGHLVNLMSMTYEKGARVAGMIEDRLGSAAYIDFLRCVVKKYRYRILRVADFRNELEAYTGPMEKRMGKSWQQFFHDWMCEGGLSDWCVEKVSITQPPKCLEGPWKRCPLRRKLLLCRGACPEMEPGVRVEVWLHQKAKHNENTVLGFALPNGEGYPITIPIMPCAGDYQLSEPKARVTNLGPDEKGGARLKVEAFLPTEPSQVAVDPDQVLPDADPSNNYWHTPVRWRITPVYTFLEETDLTTAYDRWNVILGPWLFSPPYQDAWFTRSTMVGLRAGAYRTQEFTGGAYVGFRTDYRDVVYGVDGMWNHPLGPYTQAGMIFEQRLAEFNHGDPDAVRAVAWLRKVFLYGSSLYLPPIHYVEGFMRYSDNFLPFPTQTTPTGVRFDRTTTLGAHYRINYLTPYWDPEGGFQFDAWYEGGMAQQPSTVGLTKLSSQFSTVASAPNLSPYLPEGSTMRSVTDWFASTRFAMRAFGATAAPSRGEFFTMGGSDLFRGFDMAQRQGSTVFVGSVEWRVPIMRRMKVDLLDHVMGLRNAYAAFFYDVGDAYTNGQAAGPVAHALGVGLRLDVAWLSIVERTTLRLDVAKAINTDTGIQVWVGINHPF